LILAGLLFILSCQFLGALLALLLKPTASAVSIGTLLTAPAFGFMGIGFPRLGMNAFAYGWGALLPGTWYLTARIDQTVRGTPIDLSWKPLLILLAFTVGLAGLAAWRLEIRRGSNDRSRGKTAPQQLAEVPS
jgi:ABC-2 type transport system permease protein